MIPGMKIVSFFLKVACLGVICIVSASFVHAASLSLSVRNSRIDIHAEQVPLIDILRTISDQAEIVIESRDPLADLVSLNLKGASIEHCLRILLGSRNYALTYTKNEENQIVPASMRIYGSGSVTLIKPGDAAETDAEPPDAPPEDPLQRIERK